MAAREVLLRYRAMFDASGAEAAIKANEAVKGSTGGVQKANETLGASAVDLEVKQRRVETVTRVLTMEFSNMASKGFSTAGAMQAAASAVGFLGNTIKIASGPIGIAVSVATALASALLMWHANAAKAAKEIDRTTLSVRGLTSATYESVGATGIDTTKTKEFLEAQAKVASMTDVGVKQFRLWTLAARDHTSELVKQVLANTFLVEGTKTAAESTFLLSEQWKRQGAVLAALLPRYDAIIAREKEYADLVAQVEASKLARRKAANDEWESGLQSVFDHAEQFEADLEQAVQDAEREKLQMRVAAATATANVAGALANYLEATNQANFQSIKNIRYAETIINTASAVMQALQATPNYYVNIGLAIAAAATGALQLATIASTSPGTAGAIPSPAGLGAGGAGGGAGGGGGGGGGPPTVGFGGGGGGPMTVTINLENLTFQGLDPDSVPAGQMRRFVRRLAELLAYEINGLGNRLSR